MPHFSADLAAVAPVVIVVATALVVLVFDLFRGEGDLRAHVSIAGVGLALAGWLTFSAWPVGPAGAFGLGGATGGAPGTEPLYLLATGPFTLFLWGLILLTAFLALLMSLRYLKERAAARGEYVILVLLATSGMMVLVAANDLVLLFLALETFSLALYVLSGFRPKERASLEAALKYFVLGSFAAAFFLYGTALIFASLATTNLTAVGAQLAKVALPLTGPTGAVSPVLLLGFGLVLVGLAFKATIVPFHQWTPDVYVGAPTPVTAFMAAATKAAAFGALLRVLWIGFPVLQSVWVPLVGALAVATMLVGNLAALVQGDIKRMLAFSAVAHAGYVLVAVAAGPPDGAMAAVFYLLVYALMNLGAFGVVIALGRADDGARDATRLEDFRGLSRRHPGLALALAIFLLSLTGLPPTAGFLGKWYIFRAAIGAGLTPLAVFLVLMSAVSAFYYFRPVLLMYMAEPEETGPIQVSAGEAVAVAVTALIVAGALVLAVPFAKSARVAGLMGAEDPQAAGVSGGPGQALYFAAPNFDKDRRVATPAGGTNE